jgi:hypothetical protein
MLLKRPRARTDNSRNRMVIQISNLNGKSYNLYKVRSWKETILIVSVWFVVAFNRALPEGLSTKIPVLNIENNSSAEKIRESWGQGDAGSLLDIAITWANLKRLDPVTQYWIPGLWAPGLSILEVPLIWISRIGFPIFWSLLIITLSLWSILFLLIWRYFSSYTGRIPMALVFISLLWSWDFIYLLKDYIFYTEGIAFSLLLIGLILLSIRVISPYSMNNLGIYFSGILIGISIWVRHTNDSGLIFLFILACTGFLLSKKYSMHQPPKQKKKRKTQIQLRRLELESKSLKSFFRLSMITSGIALLVTLPWRLISHFHFQGAPFLMSSASGGLPAIIWSLPNSPSALYWGSYGSNWACKINLETCYQIQSEILDGTMSRSHLFLLAFKSIIENPIRYLEERLHFLWANWIPSFQLDFGFQNLVAFVFILLSFYSIYLCLIIKDKRKYALIIIWGSFLVMNFAQLAIIHYESRYFIPVRLLILGLILSLLSLNASLKQSVNEQDKN